MYQKIIKCHNLVLGGGRNQLSNPINLDIYTNQWLGILGENGIGKSTFFKNILNIQQPISGHITVFGEPPGICNRWISYIAQEHELNLTQHMSSKTLTKSIFEANKLGLPFFGKKLDKIIDQLFEIAIGIASTIRIQGVPLRITFSPKF